MNFKLFQYFCNFIVKNYYICSMKNERVINGILENNGFSYNADEDFWERGTWKVRRDRKFVEIYEDIEGGRYFKESKYEIDVQSVIDSM